MDSQTHGFKDFEKLEHILEFQNIKILNSFCNSGILQHNLEFLNYVNPEHILELQNSKILEHTPNF